MNDEVVKLIMRRDGISYEEATQAVDECVRSIYEVLDEDLGSLDTYEAVTSILARDLGLEPDYLEMLL